MEDIGRVIGIGLLLMVTFWVYKDARSRGMNAMGWSVFVFLLLIIGLPLYLLSRKKKIN